MMSLNAHPFLPSPASGAPFLSFTTDLRPTIHFMHSNETSSIYIPYLLTWSIIELNLHKLKSYNILNSTSRLLKRFISLLPSNWLFAYNSNRLLVQSSSSNFILQTQNLLIILSANCLLRYFKDLIIRHLNSNVYFVSLLFLSGPIVGPRTLWG